MLFWPCFQAFGRLFFLRKGVKVYVILPSSTKTAGLMQTRPRNFSGSRPLFCRYPTVVILLDIAHVVAGYRELAKGFEPIRNEEIVSRYVRGTQRECTSKPLKRSTVERILVFKR